MEKEFGVGVGVDSGRIPETPPMRNQEEFERRMKNAEEIKALEAKIRLIQERAITSRTVPSSLESTKQNLKDYLNFLEGEEVDTQ